VKFYPAERVNVGISAGAVAASFAVASPHFAGSLAVGAALEAMNFRFMHGVAEALFAGSVNGGGAWVGVLSLRLGLVFAGIVAAMTAGAHPLALVIGLSLAMPATVIAAWLNRSEVIEQEPNPGIDPEDPSWDRYSIWRAAERDEEDGEIG
jgi:hypothetical protein